VKVLAYGEIMDGGASVFSSVAKRDGKKLIMTFSGVIRIDYPYKHLQGYIADLERLIPEENLESVEFDFRELSFCNSNGFYIIMDITELIIAQVDGPVFVKRLEDDDWQQETLPILLNVDEPDIGERVVFEDLPEI